ncbi:hypothetical protein MtrunA17_Chr8g0362141 [Medicago truncatula]|uniref:Transmembrane protein n=1 Tax=Medicago truncatula TaxID=3880 RepID=A0A396GND0_MEDTR|nr:hypothetical protein MtrunA17_Chr8g0362141 [Medicago truncatula]
MGEFMSRQYTTKNSRFSCGFSCDQISTGIPGDIAAFSDEVFCGYSSSRNVRRKFRRYCCGFSYGFFIWLFQRISLQFVYFVKI